MAGTRRSFLFRPGPDGWECWAIRPGLLPAREAALPSPNATQHAIVGLPTRDLTALPLWVPSSGRPEELAELELSARHLLRRGLDVVCLPVETVGPRSLVLAVTAAECADAMALARGVERYEIGARLWPADGAAIVVWREFGAICFALYRGAACVYFSGGSPAIPALCGAIQRTVLRLRAEAVITRDPEKLRLFGSFSEEERRGLQDGLGLPIESADALQPPRLPEPPADVPPPAAREERTRRTARRKILGIGSLAAAVYGAVALATVAMLGWNTWKIRSLRAEAETLAAPAAAAREEITRWREIRSAVDPRLFALDLLAAVAAQLPSDQVRLTLFSLESGRLSLAGEAPNVPQAYEFIEKIKTHPALAEFDWTSNQPQLAGKQMVRFEMEGRQPDAQVVEE
jgi:hypothetical protein